MQKVHYMLVSLFFSHLYYCFSQGVWTQKASLPSVPRYDAMSFSVGSKGYVIGGFDGGTSFFNHVWEYDGTTNIWVQKQNFQSMRWMGVGFSIGSKGYLGTGDPGLNNDLWEYNPSTDTWTQKASLPGSGRYAGLGFSIGTKGYIGAGETSTGKALDLWEYDAVSNGWQQKANLPSGKRSFATCFSANGKGYITTGIDSANNQLNDVWEYNPASDTWIQKINFPAGKRRDIDGARFTIGSYAYLGTGWDQLNTIFHNDFWRYDPTSDTWLQIQNFPGAARMGMSGFSINNKGYIGLGVVISASAFNDLWEYYPDSIVSVNEQEMHNDLIFFPNPTSGKFKVQSSKFKIQEVQVYNTSGEKVHSSKLSSNSTTDISNLPNAVYFVHVICKEGKTVKKIILAK